MEKDSMKGTLCLLRMPLLWGGIVFVGFYSLIDQGLLQNSLVRRYFASHPVEYITAGLFFVGLAAVAIKAVEVAFQFLAGRRFRLGPAILEPHTARRAATYLDCLKALPDWVQQGCLGRRYRDALELIERKDSADQLEEQLRQLADSESERMDAGFALVRIIIWGIPILGFLGTVIGITLAIASLSPEQLEQSLPEVTSGLGVAFDTTALALALSMVLMFAKFGAERLQWRLLTDVDARVGRDLLDRFRDEPQQQSDAAAVQRVAEVILESNEKLVERQTELWWSTVDAAQHRWSELADSAGERLQRELTLALGAGLQKHAEVLCQAEAAASEANRKHWDRVLEALRRSSEAAVRQQEELVRQGDLLREIITATGQIRTLEKALNDNLSALAGAKHFEETVTSLAAAVQLLSVRLGSGFPDARRVRLPVADSASSAA
jgi:biopolymer transport protein ExbB/TolQ